MVAFIGKQALERLFVSEVTFAEIRFGIELAPDPLRRAELNEWLTDARHGRLRAHERPAAQSLEMSSAGST